MRREVCKLLSGGGSNNLVGGPVRSNMRLESNVWSPFTETKRLWGCDRQVLGEDDLTVVGQNKAKMVSPCLGRRHMVANAANV